LRPFALPFSGRVIAGRADRLLNRGMDEPV
jgi:hypothetical protein